MDWNANLIDGWGPFLRHCLSVIRHQSCLIDGALDRQLFHQGTFWSRLLLSFSKDVIKKMKVIIAIWCCLHLDTLGDNELDRKRSVWIFTLSRQSSKYANPSVIVAVGRSRLCHVLGPTPSYVNLFMNISINQIRC